MILVETESELKPWQRTHNGLTWQDMPGNIGDEQKINFALYRRGLYRPERDDEGGIVRFARVDFGKPVGLSRGAAPERIARVKAWLAERIKKGCSAYRLGAMTGVCQPLISRLVNKKGAGMSTRNLAKIEAVMHAHEGEGGEVV